MIDLIGMGGSSRPENFDKSSSAQASIDYFTDYIEKWRVKMNNLTGFYIAGHSFGGYIVGNYALKYKQHIKRTLLISPIGVRDPPKPKLSGIDEYIRVATKISEMKGQPAVKLHDKLFMRLFWSEGKSMFTLLKLLGESNASKLIDDFSKGFSRTYAEGEREVVCDYLF